LAAINITPLLDVLLILMSVLLLLAPRFMKPLPVELPRTSLSGQPVAQSSVQVALQSSGELWLEGHTTSLTEIRAHIVAGQTTLEIGAARNAPYGEVVKLVEALRDAHPREILLLTQ